MTSTLRAGAPPARSCRAAGLDAVTWRAAGAGPRGRWLGGVAGAVARAGHDRATPPRRSCLTPRRRAAVSAVGGGIVLVPVPAAPPATVTAVVGRPRRRWVADPPTAEAGAVAVPVAGPGRG
ncbi:MAG TPA: hypothetical protein VFU19_06740 [Iamia sp.]|nr:hypothetical protein [Iamia sp.]